MTTELLQAIFPVLTAALTLAVTKFLDRKKQHLDLQKSSEEVRLSGATALQEMQKSYTKFCEDAKAQYDQQQSAVAQLRSEITLLKKQERENLVKFGEQAEKIASLEIQQEKDKALIKELTGKVAGYELQIKESERKMAQMEQELRTYRTRE